MQRKSQENQASHARQRRFRLGLRRHAPTKGLAPSKERKRRRELGGRIDGGAHRRVRKRRSIQSLRTLLHIGELVAKRGDPALVQPVRHRRHEPMRHPGARAMRYHVASCRLPRQLQKTRDGMRPVHLDPYLPAITQVGVLLSVANNLRTVSIGITTTRSPKGDDRNPQCR